jgi:hypothetical protein
MSLNPTARAVVLLAALVTAAPLLAAPAETETKSEPPAQALRKKLDRPVTIDVVDQPLDQALKLLGDEAGVRLTLEADATPHLPVAEAGPGAAPGSERVLPKTTLKAKGMKLRQALRSLLEPQQLHFAVVGDRVSIGPLALVMERQMEQTVSLDVDQTPFSEALKRLAKETAANLVVDARAGKVAETPVTLQAEDVPLETSVHLLAEMAGLKPVRVGNILFVTTKELAAAMLSNPDFAPGGTGNRSMRAATVSYLPTAPANVPFATPAAPPPIPPARPAPAR